VETLADRMEEVLAKKGWSAREWARRANLREEKHVSSLIDRSRKNPERLAGDINTFAKLADAAGVSLDWLALGRGARSGSAMLTDDAKYPSRGPVLALATMLNFPEPAINAVREHDEPTTDPGADYWFRLLELKRTQLREPRPSRPARY
jgi:hypothetical protein